MDLSTVIGLGGAMFFIAFGIIAGGGAISSYMDMASVLITVGGAFSATIASHPMERIKKLVSVTKIAFFGQDVDPAQTILTLLSFSEKARREGLLALEDDLEEVSDIFLKSGVQLVVDGTEPELVKNIMSAEIEALDFRHSGFKQIIDDIAAYLPAFGMIGTLIGLIVMMKSLGGDPSGIGSGMAAALLTTLYGAILANAIFMPIAAKLDKRNRSEIQMKEIVIEGTLSIQAGDNPRILQQKLTSYFAPDVRAKISEQIGE